MNERIHNVANRRLLQKNATGEVIEDITGMFSRVANHLATSDAELATFNALMTDNYFLPNSPCLVNAGVPDRPNQLSACFVLGVPDSIEGIYDTLKETALIHKSGGGTGFSFSNIRPTNSAVQSTGGVASGPVSFMKVFDASTEGIKQGGVRRGANMGVLRVDHPDIMEFITCKDDGVTLQNFNISVGITNAFMQALIERREYTLYDPRTKQPHSKLKAKDVLDAIVDCSWRTGDPGIIFIDRINDHNPLIGDNNEIEATNPCLHPDSMVETVEGRIRITDITEPTKVYSMHKGQLVLRKCSAAFCTKKDAKVLKITLASGKELVCTPDHLIHTDDGWVEAQQLVINKSKVTHLCRSSKGHAWSRVKLSTQAYYTPEHRLIAEAPDDMDVHHINGDSFDNRLSNLQVLSHGEHSRITCNDTWVQPTVRDAQGHWVGEGIRYQPRQMLSMPDELRSGLRYGRRVIKIEDYGVSDVYDLTVEETHNYIADFMVVHNCGEQPLAPYEACGLGSINLAQLVNANGVFDYDKLRQVTMDAVLFLHRMMKKSEYPNEKIAKRVHDSAKIGLGHMGFADALIKMKIPYTSEEAINFAANVAQTIIDASVVATHQIGQVEGTFPLFGQYKIPKHIKHALQREGIPEDAYTPAHSTLTTIAPTGTISIIADCSSGIEPVFYMEQEENRADAVIVHRHPLYETWKANNPNTPRPGYFQDLDDIDYATHIAIQSTFQRFICSGVSKTVNLPNDATRETIAQIIHEAYYTGCKGTTIYRDGSKANQVISNADGSTSLGSVPHTVIVPAERPETLEGKTYQIRTGYGDMLVTINSYRDKPFEVICQLGKSGASEMAKAEAISRLVSILLRCSVDVGTIINQLEGIVGGNPTMGKLGTIYSIPDALAKIMKIHTDSLTDIAVPAMMKCPECKLTNLQAEGSCIKCLDCGWKSCS